MINISISNKKYKVKEAKTEEELKQGLKGVEELPEDEGMLFYFDPPREVSMTMQDTLIALDQIFINEDDEVIKVVTRKPNDEELVSVENTAYVLEVNANSGIKKGDELEFENSPLMKILDSNGEVQAELWGNERIFSRKNTRVLIKKAKKAQLSQSDSDFKALGNYVFKCIRIQDGREPEYVEISN